MTVPIQPGATLGIVGGGQLGRMFVAAAHRMGYRVCVLCPSPEEPAGQVADELVRGELADGDAVAKLASMTDVITLEFENVNVDALARAEGHAWLRPGLSLLEVARDRRREKRTFASLGLPLPRFAVIESEEDCERTGADFPMPAVLKTALAGYDGKGQRRIESPEALGAAWKELGQVPTVLEAFVPFVGELSVVGVRGHDGEIALYEPCHNTHVDHVLDLSLAPAPLSPEVTREAEEITRALLEGLDVTGVLCVELFLLEDGRLLVNEIAPRPHNSGHLTIEGHATSQFEQQVRAACGLPLGSTRRVVPSVAMCNLLGDLWQAGPPNWPGALAVPGANLHLYGKSEARPGRKMGHITAVGADPEEARSRALEARARLLEPAQSAATAPSAGGS